MSPNKSDTIRLRIHPDKKAALDAVAKKQQLDLSKLLMAQIEKLIAQKPPNLNTQGVEERESEGQDAAAQSSSVRISFRPLPGDEQPLNQLRRRPEH